MNDIMNDAVRAMNLLCKPLGEYAPRVRRLIADYKDKDGVDLHQEFVVCHYRQATDASLVEYFQENLAAGGYAMTALVEYTEGGTGRALYLAPGYLEEFAAEMGMTMPKNIAAVLTAAGVRPVNWEELTHGG